jgi:pyruvate dehydrogenase E2 component (dihydrolipoamide acetyltransferase)
MAVEVILPKVDMDMATGIIAVWHVKEGDTVKKGMPLFDIETDKAAMEVECPADGIIRNITAQKGAVVPVGQTVAHIYQANETLSPPVTPKPQEAPVVTETRLDAAFIPVLTEQAASKQLLATPLAKRLARQNNVDLSQISGSGPRGRIVAADVQSSTPVAVATTASQPAHAEQTIIPLDGMRRTIAQRLTLSKQTIPHFYLTSTCDLTQLLAIRANLNARAPLGENKVPAWKLSINDFVIKAMAMALARVPAANVTWNETNLIQHFTSDVGVAVSVEGGLFTPVVKSAETKSLSVISNEMKDLAARARARKLQPAEYQGGTTAISNLGMFGIEQFTAIINPPHASILAVGAGIEKFVPVNGQPVLRTQMICTLSVDHRAVDGAVGAQLLSAFRSFIEEPALMLA